MNDSATPTPAVAPAASPTAASSASATAATAAPAAEQLGCLWLAAATLCQRELVRFFRQRNRVIGALATPLVFWILLGSGLTGSFVAPGSTPGSVAPGAGAAAGAAASGQVTYLEYFFPGTVVLILLFTAIFATITVIEDRREGFLQGVLVAPVPRLAIVLGKVLGGALIATIQGAIFLLLWPLVGHWPGALNMLVALVSMFVLAVGLTGLGLCIAWPMDSTAAFHAVMNLFLMPMWFLSGAVFPVSSAPKWLAAIMWLNPLTYGQTVFADALTGGRSHTGAPLPGWAAALVMVAFTVAIVLLAGRLVNRPRKDGLP